MEKELDMLIMRFFEVETIWRFVLIFKVKVSPTIFLKVMCTRKLLKALTRAKSRGFSYVMYLGSVHKKYLEEATCNIFVVKLEERTVPVEELLDGYEVFCTGTAGADLMVRAAKRSMVDELEAMLDVVDPQPPGRSLSMRRRTFDMPDDLIQKELAAGVAEVVQMLDQENELALYNGSE